MRRPGRTHSVRTCLGFHTLLIGRIMRSGFLLFALTALLGAQGAKPPAPTPKPAKGSSKSNSAAATPPAPLALTKAVVVFHTNDAAKATETLLSIYVLRKDGYAAAMKQSVAGDPGKIELDTFTAVKTDLGKLRILIKPKAEDTWRFNCTLYLYWKDNTVTPIAFDNISLSERNPTFEGALSGS
jgi:hypothetical protein